MQSKNGNWRPVNKKIWMVALTLVYYEGCQNLLIKSVNLDNKKYKYKYKTQNRVKTQKDQKYKNVRNIKT